MVTLLTPFRSRLPYTGSRVLFTSLAPLSARVERLHLKWSELGASGEGSDA